jgi:hypothetical protein
MYPLNRLKNAGGSSPCVTRTCGECVVSMSRTHRATMPYVDAVIYMLQNTLVPDHCDYSAHQSNRSMHSVDDPFLLIERVYLRHREVFERLGIWVLYAVS